MAENQMIYGCMGLGGRWDRTPYSGPDIEHAHAAVEAALEIGITIFDHADIYRYGKAEAVFGEILARDPGLRERITLQTKCGIRLADDQQPGIYDLRGSGIVQRVQESLARLRTDRIDLLLLHRPDPLADPQDVAEALHSLYRQGLVRQFGVSNMSAPQMDRLQRSLELPLVANQVELSLHRRDWLEAEVLVNTPMAAEVGFPAGTVEYCLLNSVQIQAWGALAGGRFTGSPETPADHAAAALIRDLADQKDTTPETILLWWLKRHPAGIVPVIGTSRPERIRACGGAVAEPDLSHEEWYRLWITARGAKLP